jgi:hypothetical protein
MSAAERDFNTFYLEDNVYELADGVIPDIAERLDVSLADTPSTEDLQELMGKVGKNKVLRNNTEITAIERDEMVELVARSGVQETMHRSMWGPYMGASKGPDKLIAFGGMANWQDRTAKIINQEYLNAPVHLLGGERIMDTGTEVDNPNVIRLHDAFGRYPTEAEYSSSVVLPTVSKRHNVLATAYSTTNADEMIARFFEQNPSLLEQRLMVARVANAGV